MTKCVITIAGSDPSGGAGIQNDLKTIAAHGLHGASCITVLTVQNTGGLTAPSHFVDPLVVGNQIRAVAQDLHLDATKIGLLGNSAIAESVASTLSSLKHGPTVIDPVIRTGTGHDLLADEPLDVLKPVLGLADVLTPNVPEAEYLSGISIDGVADAEEAARKIIEMGPDSVVVTGGHLKDDPLDDILVTRESTKVIGGNEVPGPTHGTGCTFSTSIACNLALGWGLEESVARAKRMTESAIANGTRIGSGNGPVNPLGSALKESAALEAIEQVAVAVALLEQSPEFSQLLPQVGTNLAMAPAGADDITDVVGLSGRIVRVGNSARASGCPMRGGSSHMARMALALRKRTEIMGCCMNIRFDRSILDVCGILGLAISKFDRDDEPAGKDTMSWGLISAMGTAPHDTPDVIYDEGSPGKEAMIRVLGRDPGDVSGKAIRIARSLK